MKKIILLYDCPLKKCDKLWVYEGLKKSGYKVKVIDAPFRISHLDQRGKAGVMLAVLVIMIQCIYAVSIAGRDDIIFCWLQKAGIYCNKFAGGKKKIISYNWLNPKVKKSTEKLYKDVLENPNCRIIVNSPENKTKNLTAFHAKNLDNVYVIPDVFDQNTIFREPVFRQEGRYCFMGGRANRDWKLFLNTAEKNPEVPFVGVAAASDWNREWKIPNNVKMYYDIPASQYYELMKNAYVGFYPLKEDRVSGLINIIKGAADGIPVLVTRMDATALYYSEDTQDLMFTMGDTVSAGGVLNNAFSWTEEMYIRKVQSQQRHIRERFSPDYAMEKIQGIMKSF